jgi:hypothetical protein
MPVPYTSKQRAMFNAKCKEGDREMCKLAKEANALPTRKKKGKR